MTSRKKLIRILLFLLFIALLVFGVYWFVSRHRAQQSGSTPATFREFLGYGTTAPTTPSQTGGELSSEFTSPGQTGQPSNEANGSGSGSNESASSTTGTETSQFTNDTLAPAGTGTGSGSSSGSSSIYGNGSGSGTSGSSTSSSAGVTGAVSATGTSTPVCTDADTNITFTPEELARLQALQDRFYAIAQTLHTDADVATEKANYDDFKLKKENLDDLLASCNATAPNLTDTAYTNKVPTPFWYVKGDIRASGSAGYSYENTITSVSGQKQIANAAPGVPLGYLGVPGQIGGLTKSVYNADAIANALRSIEQVLRLNLW